MKDAGMDDVLELLSRVHFFEPLGEVERAEVAALLRPVRFPAGTIIFRERETGGVLYILTRGRVELSVVDEDGEKVVVDALQPGEFFGEMSLLDGGDRSTSAVALEDVETLCLERDAFLALMRRRADAALSVLASLASRLRKTDELLRHRVRNPNEVVKEQETLGDHVADAVARFGGSWRFMFTFAGLLVFWIAANTVFVFVRRAGGAPVDPYPFILLNLFLSMLAAIQAPVIMMSQNRQDAKDRIRSELDYQVNLKAELEIMQLHDKFDGLRRQLLAAEPQEPPRAAGSGR